MKAQRSRALSNNRWQVSDYDRDDAVRRTLKISPLTYNSIKHNIDQIFKEYSCSQLD